MNNIGTTLSSAHDSFVATSAHICDTPTHMRADGNVYYWTLPISFLMARMMSSD